MDDLDEYDNTETDFIKKLQNASKEDMMEIIYKSIIEKSMGALNHDAPVSVKIEGVQIVLDFFKDREEYEKCTELKKIIDKLSC
jgi:3-dehydroquinate dehydratase